MISIQTFIFNFTKINLQGIGDSSQGFANAIIFVIFTKNIRESFIRYFCCRKRQSAAQDVEAEVYSNSSRLNTVSSGHNTLLVRENQSVSSEANNNEVSLLFGSLRSNANSEHSGAFYSYGIVS